MKRHPVDAISLVAGLVFSALGITFLAGARVTQLDLDWTWPLVLIVIGGVVLLAGLSRGERDKTDA